VLSSHGPGASRAIRGVLSKFADLPHYVEEEIRDLDEARRRIPELEREIKHHKGARAAQQTDARSSSVSLSLPFASADDSRADFDGTILSDLKSYLRNRAQLDQPVCFSHSTGFFGKPPA
jgi:hypothetical protein